MKLYVDDRRSPPAEDWHVVRSVTEAIRALNLMVFDEVSLDHDICHEKEACSAGYDWNEGYKVACNENFSAVAMFIARTPPEFRPKSVRIHTTNVDGAINMRFILAHVDIVAEWVPDLRE